MPRKGQITLRTATSIGEIERGAWDGLDHGSSPFLRHGFLTALEDSHSIGARAGWQPAYVLIQRDGFLVGATAAFIKNHSYGEYIFDWGWANAASRARVAYYPKLVIAAPMTPATGPRILLPRDASSADKDLITAAVVPLAASTWAWACARIASKAARPPVPRVRTRRPIPSSFTRTFATA